MAIRLIQRIGRLVQADAHGLVESLEDRSLLLKQHLREAELELQHKRARIEALADEERQIREDARRLEEALAGAEEDAQLALEQDRDDLARFAIRKLIPKRDELSALRSRLAERGNERARLEEKRATQEVEFEELRARVRAQLADASREAHCASYAEPPVADEEVEMELLRRKQGGSPS